MVVADARGVTFQWKFNGTDIPGATGDSLLLTNVSAANEGQYSVVVTNSAGSVTSAPAALMLDTDGDGLPDTWEKANFTDPDPTHPLNPANQRSAGDPDGDGISNLDEFLDGTNPTRTTSLRPRLTAYSDAGGSVMVAPMKLSYDLGETVTLTATPFAPNVFIGWAGDLKTGDLISTTNPVTFPMNGNKTVRARFATPVPLPTGLVACWRAENNAQDVSGVNNGTLVNSGTPAAEVSFGVGKVGRAFGFHGAAIKALASTTLDVGVGNGLTIEAWIKPADLAHQYPLVEWNEGSRIGTHFWISADFSGQGGSGCLFANIVDTNQVFHFVISQAGLLNTSDWQHVALTYDKSSGMGRLFLNGVNVASANVGSFTPLTTPDLYLGHRLGAAFYSGLMDELTIYNRALTANEIFSIYNADFLGKDFTRPYFTSPSQLPAVALGADYTQQLRTILGTPPISFSLSAGALPPGMTLSSAGVVSGVPSTPGTFDFTVLATDAVGTSTEQLYVLRVLQPVALPADLIAWWRGEPAMGSAVPDIIGGHDGDFFSGNTAAAPVYAAHGKVGSAFAFDGTVYVRIPDAVELRPSEMTAEAWVFPTMQSGDHQSVIARGSSTNEDDIWWLGVFSGKPRFWSKHFGLGMQVLEAPSAIPLNQWTHLAISFDGTTKRLYVNGAQVAFAGRTGCAGL